MIQTLREPFPEASFQDVESLTSINVTQNLKLEYDNDTNFGKTTPQS